MNKTILGSSLLCLCMAFAACGGDDEPEGAGGSGGEGGTAGKGGSGGKAGTAGKGGSAGKGGGAGKGGSVGAAGESGSGAGGSAGAAENGGAAGDDTGGGGIAAVGGEGGTGGEAGAGGQPGVTIELRGRWTGEFGPEIIDNHIWASAELIEFSNDENIAITRNPEDAEFDPSKFNRIVWTEVDRAVFFYCTTDFGLDSLVAARAGDGRADATDPETGGCGEGDFAWTKLTSDDIEIFGTFTSVLGTEKIDALTWTVTSSSGTSVARVIEFSNETDEAITQNDPDAASDPSKFNRIVWTVADGSYFYCAIDAGLDTLAEAQAADTVADATDPATGGCAGAPWTRLTISL